MVWRMRMLHIFMHQGILMLGIAFIQFLLSTLAGIFGAKVALMTGRDLREQVYEKLIHFSRRMIGSMELLR